MKSPKPNLQIIACLLFGCSIILTNIACNQKKTASDTTTFEEKPSTTMPAEAPVSDVKTPVTETESSTSDSLNAIPTRSTPPPAIPKSGSPDDKTIYPTPAPKDCQPNFKMIGKPKDDHYLFYLTGFKLGEFKCWNLVEEHGVSICNGKPCVIYYVDDPNGSISGPPNYVDPKFLKTHGVGQFSHDKNWWEMKGSKIWGREGKQYLYFNTNNNAGG